MTISQEGALTQECADKIKLCEINRCIERLLFTETERRIFKESRQSVLDRIAMICKNDYSKMIPKLDAIERYLISGGSIETVAYILNHPRKTFKKVMENSVKYVTKEEANSLLEKEEKPNSDYEEIVNQGRYENGLQRLEGAYSF